jgi:hypothetical protein
MPDNGGLPRLDNAAVVPALLGEPFSGLGWPVHLSRLSSCFSPFWAELPHLGWLAPRFLFRLGVRPVPFLPPPFRVQLAVPLGLCHNLLGGHRRRNWPRMHAQLAHLAVVVMGIASPVRPVGFG